MARGLSTFDRRQTPLSVLTVAAAVTSPGEFHREGLRSSQQSHYNSFISCRCYTVVFAILARGMMWLARSAPLALRGTRDAVDVLAPFTPVFMSPRLTTARIATEGSTTEAFNVIAAYASIFDKMKEEKGSFRHALHEIIKCLAYQLRSWHSTTTANAFLKLLPFFSMVVTNTGRRTRMKPIQHPLAFPLRYRTPR